MPDPLNLNPERCRERQQRLRERLAERQLDRAVLVSHENVQWLTGFRSHRLMRAALVLEVDGGCTLSVPNQIPENVAADEVVTFQAQRLATIRQEQLELAIRSLADVVKLRSGTATGVEFSVGGFHAQQLVSDAFGEATDLDVDLWRLRRRKDPDELAMIRRAVDCTEAMYQTAREIIEPGISELEVFNQLRAAAVRVAGEPLTAIGNDYQCGSPGGPPRERVAQDGELYILDLGPCYRGYYADNCRTIAVNRNPTDEQQHAWEAIVKVLEMVEQTVRPGVSCRAVYETAKQMLDEYAEGAFSHHLGHGFGLFPHEAPHLNPNWDDIFEVGDCFTAEPGLYTNELRAGIRLEQNYRVTADGVDRLTNFALEL
ncbi:MAG: Xaa-Pro peptidase family protein [Planctomycetes bacterium]|nr:Xaa-Pro peptidase family protein [Planctomycetota bacterium]